MEFLKELWQFLKERKKFWLSFRSLLFCSSLAAVIIVMTAGSSHCAIHSYAFLEMWHTILGISAYYHDMQLAVIGMEASCCRPEERFTRKKQYL
ncbi:MAG: DUF5989 family protein [Bacteroidales bacterium]